MVIVVKRKHSQIMKLPASLLTLIGLALCFPTSAQAITFHFKASAVFPVQTEEPDLRPNALPGATIVKKVTLGTKEIINLALGLPLKTKVPKDTVLAVALDHDLPDNAKLVVYDKHLLTELATVLNLIDPVDTNAGSKDGEKGSGNGLSRGTIHTTTLGTPGQNGFQTTDVCGAATASKTPTPIGPIFKMSVTSILGPILANIDALPLDGLIIKGSFSAGGKPLDPF